MYTESLHISNIDTSSFKEKEQDNGNNLLNNNSKPFVNKNVEEKISDVYLNLNLDLF